LRVKRAVLIPSRAAVRAASQPAWPPPTTISSKLSVAAVERVIYLNYALIPQLSQASSDDCLLRIMQMVKLGL